MSLHRRKTVYFVIEGLNVFGCTYYFNYLFFLLRDAHGFGSRENLWVSAGHGFLYIFAAWQGGRFAERHGYLNALRIGAGGMAAALAVASAFPDLPGQMVGLAVWTVAMMFTWPALEALIAEGEPPAGLQRMVGIYNCVWSGGAAVAYFVGGAVFERLGPGSLYWLPASLFLGMLVAIATVASKLPPVPKVTDEAPHPLEASAWSQPVSPTAFRQMAWLANPFSYIAINTLLATIPELARRLGLSTTESGLICSVWFFARLAAFVGLWQWTGWHYRFRWLAVGFIGLIIGFACVVTAATWVWLVLGQILFGLCTGLLYYSSLFYSMDASETKGEHGGLHEAAIGLGIFAGPAVGALSLQLVPGHPAAGAWGVTSILCAGFGGLVWLRAHGKRARRP